MGKKVNFILALHAHQPVGNFDFVIEDAYQKCYEPFFTLISQFPEIPFCLHYSGVLLEWMAAHHPEFFDLLKERVTSKQVELISGAFYEPILVMLPDCDRLGQVRLQNTYLKDKFGCQPQGFWLAERVWEQSLVSSIADSGLAYTMVDDSHFRYAGITGETLKGFYTTEDRGRTLNVFPMDENLRYYIPFQEPHKTIEYLRQFATDDGNNIFVYADDAEKFGVWPGTYKHVYEDKWLERFLTLVRDNLDWINLTTFSNVLKKFKPTDNVYIPDASYREMMEWALPAEAFNLMEDFVQSLKDRDEYDKVKYFIKGGVWRFFQAKYPEARRMYAKMMRVSEKVNALSKKTGFGQAMVDLYKGQCNCSYWHGVFGGLYLAHLRNAIYKHLIAAELVADKTNQKNRTWIIDKTYDEDFDGVDEVEVNTDKFVLYISPDYGGHIYEFDIRGRLFNFLATLARRKEGYHRKILRHAKEKDEEVSSIHEIVHFKQADLDKHLDYDWYRREFLIDHFLEKSCTLDEMSRCQYDEKGDFVHLPFECKISTKEEEKIITLTRRGGVWQNSDHMPVKLTKKIRAKKNSPRIPIEYIIENTGDATLECQFGIEFNFALLAGASDDRFYYVDDARNPLGNLSHRVDATMLTTFGIVDDWMKIDYNFISEKKCDVWSFPVETVSQSESGFELTFQSATLVPRWNIKIPAKSTWKNEVVFTIVLERHSE